VALPVIFGLISLAAAVSLVMVLLIRPSEKET
jgi:hypothetical protein